MARLFFALWPEPAVCDEIVAVTRGLALQEGARRLVPANLHLTLVFLGNVEAHTRDKLQQGAATVEATAFSLCLERLEFWKKPRIVCFLPTDCPEALTRLAGQLARLSRDCGLQLDERPYRPHMTLARKVTQALPDFAPRPVHWQPREFHLVESQSTEQGVKYTSRARWPLKIMR